MKKFIVVAIAVMAGACNTSGRNFVLPTTPTPPTAIAPAPTPTPTPPPTPIPPPRPGPNLEVTSVEVGISVSRTVGDSPPLCPDGDGPCQYFRVTSARRGILVVDLEYVPETQPPGRTPHQVVDISLGEGLLATYWAQSGTDRTGRLTAPVEPGTEYIITLWYTYPHLAYTLRTSYAD